MRFRGRDRRRHRQWCARLLDGSDRRVSALSTFLTKYVR